MSLAIDEVLSNIIQCGSLGIGGKIQVSVDSSNEDIQVAAKDRRTPLAPCKSNGTQSAGASETGTWPLYDSADRRRRKYQRTTEGINVLTMAKRLQVIEKAQGERK